jgi:hypothetical protein
MAPSVVRSEVTNKIIAIIGALIFFFASLILGVFAWIILNGIFNPSFSGATITSSPQFYGYLVLLSLTLLGLIFKLTKPFFKEDSIKVDDQTITLTKGKNIISISNNQIKKVTIDSHLDILAKATVIGNFMTSSTQGVLSSLLGQQILKRYFLIIEYERNGAEQKTVFDLTNYRSTESVAQAFRQHNVQVIQADEDIVESIWKTPSNRLPLIISIIGGFIINIVIEGVLDSKSMIPAEERARGALGLVITTIMAVIIYKTLQKIRQLLKQIAK